MTDLWARADLSGGPTACWPWMAGKNDNGYGRLRFKGRTTYAHRAAYELAVGVIPEGMFVCHTCDNPPCVNPGHLFVGTALDNNRDRIAKGRTARRLQRMAARIIADSRIPVEVAAAHFKVSRRTVYRAVAEAKRESLA